MPPTPEDPDLDPLADLPLDSAAAGEPAAPATQGSPRRSGDAWRKRLRLGGLILLLLYPLYLGLANLFLSSPIGPWALNLRPRRLQVSWQRAWSLYPGDLAVRGLKLRGQASRADWSLDVDRGRGWIDLVALPRREFRVARFEGEGVRSVTRRKPAEAEPPGASREAREGHPQRRGWRLAFERVHLRHVREIALDAARLLGDSEVQGTFRSEIGAKLNLQPTRLSSRGARLQAGETPILRDLDVAAEVSIAPYAPSVHGGMEGFDFVSGTLRTSATSQGLGAGGTLRATVRLEKGVVLRDTSLVWMFPPEAAPSLASPAPSSPINPALPNPAPGTLRLAVEPGAPGGALQLTAALPKLAVGGPKGGPATFAARNLTLHSATSETRLSRLFAMARQLQSGDAPAAGSWTANVAAGPVDLVSAGFSRSWILHLDQAQGVLSLAALTRHTFALDALRGSGGHGWVSTVERAGPQLPSSPSRGWGLRFTGARIDGIQDFTWNDLALHGVMNVAGSFVRDGDGKLRVEGAKGDLGDGTMTLGGVTLGEQTVGRDLDLHAALDLPPFDPAQRHGLALLDIATAALSGSGKALGASSTAPQALNLDLRLVHGALAPDTQFALTLPRLPGLSFIQTAQPLFVAGAVVEGRLNLSAEARGLTLGAIGAGGKDSQLPPLARARRATLALSTSELRLARLVALEGGEKPTGKATVPAGLVADLSGEALELGGVAGAQRWSVKADRGGARLDLSALAEHRISLAELTALGVELRLDKLSPAPSRPAAAAKPWSIEAQGARLMQIRSVGFGPTRIVGPAELSGALSFDPARRLVLRQVSLSLPAGRVESGTETVARDLSLHATLDMAPATGKPADGLAVLRRVSGSATGKAHVSSLGFLRRYLETPWLEIHGQGDLEGDLRLREGRLLAGSRLSLSRAKLQASFLESLVDGDARLSAVVEADKGGTGRPIARMQARFDRLTLAGRQSPTMPYVRGQGLRIDLSSTDLDLATPVTDLKAAIDLQKADVPDLRSYNAVLPEGAGIAVLGGHGVLSLHLDFDQAANQAKGKLTLASDDLLSRFQDLEIGGRLRIETPLASHDLKGREFALAGTRLDLDGVTYREADAPPDDRPATWWAHLRFLDGAVTWGQPIALRAKVAVRMKDSGLVLNLAAQRKSFLHWFENVLLVENVAARGDIRLGAGAFEIDPLIVEGGKLDLRSRFRFGRETKAGDVYLRWGKLATGIALRDGKRDFKILSPLAWFEKREGWAKDAPPQR